MPCLTDLFKHYRGQPVEIITEHMKCAGIICECDEYGVTLIDHCSRLIRIENHKIEIVIEPQMNLKKLFGNTDLGCEDCDFCCDRRRGYRDCDNDCCDRDCGCGNDGVALI